MFAVAMTELAKITAASLIFQMGFRWWLLVVGNAKLRTLRMLAQEYVVEMQARTDR